MRDKVCPSPSESFSPTQQPTHPPSDEIYVINPCGPLASPLSPLHLSLSQLDGEILEEPLLSREIVRRGSCSKAIPPKKVRMSEAKPKENQKGPSPQAKLFPRFSVCVFFSFSLFPFFPFSLLSFFSLLPLQKLHIITIINNISNINNTRRHPPLSVFLTPKKSLVKTLQQWFLLWFRWLAAPGIEDMFQLFYVFLSNLELARSFFFSFLFFSFLFFSFLRTAPHTRSGMWPILSLFSLCGGP